MSSEITGEPAIAPRLGLRRLLFLAIATIGCAVDLLTKHWVFSWPPGPGRRGEWWLVENYLGVQRALNEGALWGMGQGQVTLFATLSVAAALGIVIWIFWGQAARERVLVFALGGVLGGILGNLYDRLGMWGGRGVDGRPIRAVRDWILVCYYDWIWPNFNIADCLLVVGAGILAWHAVRSPTDERPTDERPDGA